MRRTPGRRGLLVTGLVVATCFAFGGSARAQTDTNGDLLEVLSAIPGDAIIAVAVDIGPLTELVAGTEAIGLVGEGRPLTVAVRTAIERRLGVGYTIDRIGIYGGGSAIETWAVLLFGGTTGSPSGAPVHTYREMALYDASGATGMPDTYALATGGGIVFGTLPGVTGIIDVLAGATESVATDPRRAPHLLDWPTDTQIAVMTGAEPALELLDDLLDSGPTPVTTASAQLGTESARIAIGVASETDTGPLLGALNGHLREAGHDLDELRREADEQGDLGEELALRVIHAVASETLESISPRVVGASVVIDVDVPTALSLVPPSGAGGTDRTADLLGAIPGDALGAFAIDIEHAADVLLSPLQSLVAGPESAVVSALNDTLTRHAGLTIDLVGAAGFIGPDDDSWAVMGLGSVSGSITLSPWRAYRSYQLYELGRRERLVLAAPEGGLVVGHLAAVTGVLDVLAGRTLSVAETEADALSAGATGDRGLALYAGPTVIGELSAEIEDVEGLTSGLLQLAPTRLSIDVALSSPEQASALAAMVEAGRAMSREQLAAMPAQAAESESIVQEIGILAAYEIGRSTLDEQLTVSVDGRRLTVQFDGPSGYVLMGASAAIAIPAFLRYIQRSKTTEATMNVRRLYDSAISYYDSDRVDMMGILLSPQFPQSVARTPSVVPCGDSATPDPGVWEQPTWQALNFAVHDPHYYSYQFDSEGTGVGATFVVSAFGDLDCDGVYSTFVRVGEVVEGNEVRGGAGLYQMNELE